MKNSIFSIHLFVILLVFAGTSFITEKSFAQSEFPNKEITMTINKNHAFLVNNALVLNMGYFPFFVNGKWGIRKPNGEELLPPICDSLLNADGIRFITVKNGQYELLGLDLWNWFDSSVVSIHYNNQVFTVTDKNKNISRYRSSAKEFSEQLEPLDKNINHLHYKPYKEEYNPLLYRKNALQLPYPYPMSTYVDHIGYSKEKISFYKDGKVFWERKIDFSNYSVQGGRYFVYQTEEHQKITNHVFDLGTLSPLFSIHAGQLTFFRQDSTDYFLAGKIEGTNTLSRVFDTKGNLILETLSSLKYDRGFLMENLQPFASGFPNNYNLYSFPDYQRVESNITVLSFGTNTNDPLLVQLSDPKDFVVYFNAKPIYRFHTANTVRIYSWAIVPETLQELICLEYTDRHKKSNYALISSNGKLLLESEFPIICKYNQTFNQIDLSMSKVKKGVKYPVTYSGVYFPEKEQVAFVPFVPTNWRQTGTNTILYIDNYLNKEKNKLSTSYYFLDFSGNCISGEVYTEAIFYTVNNLKLIQLRQNNVPAIYNSDAQKLCDSCYFYPWNNNPEYYSPYVIVNKSINDITLEVTDEDLQPVLPGNYLAVYDMGNYFALLTKDHQIVYVETPFK